MNKGDLIAKVAADTNQSVATVKEILNARDGVVSDALSDGDKVAIVGYGTYSVAERKARTGRNPKTGESIQIAAKNVIKFKASNALNEAVND